MRIVRVYIKKDTEGRVLGRVVEVFLKSPDGSLLRTKEEVTVRCPTCGRPVAPEDLRSGCQYCHDRRLMCARCALQCAACARTLCARCARGVIINSRTLSLCPQCLQRLQQNILFERKLLLQKSIVEQRLVIIERRIRLLESPLLRGIPLLQKIAGLFLLRKLRSLERSLIDIEKELPDATG